MRRRFLLLIGLLCAVTGSAQHTVYYWFDQQAEKLVLDRDVVDCSALVTGVHFVHFQVKDAEGLFSPVRSQRFVKLTDETTHHTPTAIYYWFDQQTEKVWYNEGGISCEGLSNGIHRLHMQVLDSKGLMIPSISALFLLLEEGTKRIYYWFDEETEGHFLGATASEIDVSHLNVGKHTLYVRIADGDGNIVGSETMQAEFEIEAVGIESLTMSEESQTRVYDIAGMRRSSTIKGILVVHGKKLLIR